MNSKEAQKIRNMPQGFHGKFSTLVNGVRHTWRIQNLVAACKDLPVSELPLSELEKYLDENVWFHGDKKPTTRELIAHYKRAEEADLNYPIILSDEFGVMDGLHRILKVHMTNQHSLLAVRLVQIPAPDYIGDF